MDKILVNVFVPAIGRAYDVFIPSNLQIGDICRLLGDAVTELSNYQYVSSGVEIICSVDKQLVLQSKRSVLDCGIQNGEHLMLC